jgi:hypothetical protein
VTSSRLGIEDGDDWEGPYSLLKLSAGRAEIANVMEALSNWVLWLGKLFFAVGGFAAGVSLLRSAPSGARMGPHAMGVAAIFIGGIGVGLFPVAQRLPDSFEGYAIWMAAESLMRTGVALLGFFLWRVFRPRSGAALAGAVGCVALLFGTLAWDQATQPRWWQYDYALASACAAQLAFAVPFAWSAVEAALEWRRSRKRVALGLADRQVSHRFLLWCVATSAFVGICFLAILVGWLGAHGRTELAAAGRIVRGLLYLVIVGSLWLGLSPPAFYRRLFFFNPPSS